MDLTYLISNENNVKGIIKELLNYLLNVNDPEFLRELTLKVNLFNLILCIHNYKHLKYFIIF